MVLVGELVVHFSQIRDFLIVPAQMMVSFTQRKIPDDSVEKTAINGCIAFEGRIPEFYKLRGFRLYAAIARCRNPGNSGYERLLSRLL